MGDSLKFGTSGLRGLAADLIGAPSAGYALAFVTYLVSRSELAAGDRLLVGEDLRESSPQIARAVIEAVAATGLRAVHCGQLPTPALALESLRLGAPAIMVTGSHIPADRNGLKFYTARGEIDKSDEAGIIAGLQLPRPVLGDALAALADPQVSERYVARYKALLPASALAGWRIGVYQHASVARDLLVEILEQFGADVVPLGRSNAFIPVDTEAVSSEVVEQARAWVIAHKLNGAGFHRRRCGSAASGR